MGAPLSRPVLRPPLTAPLYAPLASRFTSFDPATLFAAGVVGAWFDPSDLSTMYQDGSALTPAAVDSQVAVVLDKSKGLGRGSELAPDGGEIELGSWLANGSGVTVDGDLTWAAAPDNSGAFRTDATNFAIGKVFEVEIVCSSLTAGGFTFSFGIGLPSSSTAHHFTAAGTHKFIVANANSDTFARLYSEGGSTTGVIDSISIKEISGNHATQATSSRRPILRQSGALYYLEFDGVDDYLQALFTVSQPWDRISGLRQVSWLDQDRMFGGGSAVAGLLYQRTATPRLYLFDGAQVARVDVTLGNDFVSTERHDGANSRLRVDGGTYATGNSGTTLPGGLTIGAGRTGANAGNIYFYGGVMIDRELTDDEIAQTEAWMATKAGVTL